MAHQITKLNGEDQILHTAAKTTWHGLGIGVDNGISREDAEQLLPAAFSADVMPLKVVGLDGKTYDMPGKQLSYRTAKDGDGNPTFHTVDIVGEEFESLGASKLFDFVDKLCKNPGGKNVDVCGLLRDAKTFFMSVPLPACDFTVAGSSDQHETHLLIRQHASSYSVDTMSTSAVRTVCANTEHAAMNSAYASLRAVHTLESQQAMLEQATEVLGIVQADAHQLRDLLKSLTKIEPSADQIDDVLSKLFVSVDGETGRADARRTNRKAKILELAEAGAGNDLKGVRGTAYGLYNGITDFVTHTQGRESEIKTFAKAGVALPNSFQQKAKVMMGSGAVTLQKAPLVFREVFGLN